MCWSCHKVSMLEMKDSRGHPYRKCPECGATDTDVPEPGASAATKGHSKLLGDSCWTPTPYRKGRKAKK